jgi:hypothetical protein
MTTPWVDNIFHSLNVEWIHDQNLRDREAIRSEVFRSIEGYCNRSSRDSTLGYLSPVEFGSRAMAVV